MEERKNWSKWSFFNNKKIPFCGGWFVYLGYELVEEIETKLNIPESPFKLPTAFASRVNTAIIFDHIDNEILITSDDKDCFNDNILEIEEDFTKILDESTKLSGTITILRKVNMNTKSKLESVWLYFSGGDISSKLI